MAYSADKEWWLSNKCMPCYNNLYQCTYCMVFEEERGMRHNLVRYIICVCVLCGCDAYAQIQTKLKVWIRKVITYYLSAFTILSITQNLVSEFTKSSFCSCLTVSDMHPAISMTSSILLELIISWRSFNVSDAAIFRYKHTWLIFMIHVPEKTLTRSYVQMTT